MKKLVLFFSVIALLALPLLTKAQIIQTTYGTNYITVVYDGKVPGIGATGALRVSTNTGATHDYTTYPSSYSFATGFSDFIFDFSHSYYPGWGGRIKYVSKATFDAMAYGAIVKFYIGSFFYQVTKNYGYSTTGITYDYILNVRVHEPAL